MLPTILFINVKYCRSLAPKRLSDPQLPQRQETRDREVKRERGEKTQQKNRTKSELKYKEGKNKETERKLSKRREEGVDATQGNILYKGE